MCCNICLSVAQLEKARHIATGVIFFYYSYKTYKVCLWFLNNPLTLSINQSNHVPAAGQRMSCHLSRWSPRCQLPGRQRGHHGRLEREIPEHVQGESERRQARRSTFSLLVLSVSAVMCCATVNLSLNQSRGEAVVCTHIQN